MAESVYAHTSAHIPAFLFAAKAADETRRRYPTAPRNDLIVAADQLERAIEQNENARANLLLSMAADWLAQTIRDLACSDVSASHTEEFGHTLADVEALVAGAMALMLQNHTIPSVSTALVLIERARDSLASLNEGSAA